MADPAVLVGTFNEPGSLEPATPASGGIVKTTGWPQAPQAVAATGPGAPSWLVPGRPGTPSEGRLFAAQHVPRGAVSVLSPADQTAEGGTGWTVTGRVDTGGENTCHADLNPAGTWLAAASYDSATLTVIPVLDGGRLGRPIAVQAPAGSGPVHGRQHDPHLHFVLFLDDDRLLVTDLGGDRLLEYSLTALADAAGRDGWESTGSPATGGRGPGDEPARAGGAAVVHVDAEPAAEHHLPHGTGPRHLAVLPPLAEREGTGGEVTGQLAVVGELDSRMHVLERGPEGFAEVGIVPTHGEDADPDAVQDNLPSHAVVSADGALIYVGNRGRNSIGVIRRGDAPELIAEVPCGGDWPRHLALSADGRGLLVALERDDAVVHLPLDAEGIPQEPTGRVAVRRPGFVLPS